jgi:hypothetical protein
MGIILKAKSAGDADTVWKQCSTERGSCLHFIIAMSPTGSVKTLIPDILLGYNNVLSWGWIPKPSVQNKFKSA